MKFLLSLALILVVALAHRGPGGMFKPARSCELTDEKVAKMEDMKKKQLENLSKLVDMVCKGEEVDEPSIRSITDDEDLPTLDEQIDENDKSEEREGRDGNRRRRGPDLEFVKEFLTDKCSEESMETVVEDLHTELEKERTDPCEETLSFDDWTNKIDERCLEKDNSSTEEKEQKSSLCDISAEDRTELWTKFFAKEDGTEPNGHEVELGMRKIKAMKFLANKHEKNEECAETETGELSTDDIRRFLRAGGNRGGNRNGGNRNGGDRSGDRNGNRNGGDRRREDKENDKKEKSQAVTDFLEACTKVDFESVNKLFDLVEEEHEAMKEAMEKEKAEQDLTVGTLSTDNNRQSGNRQQGQRVERTEGGRPEGSKPEGSKPEGSRPEGSRPERQQGDRTNTNRQGQGNRRQGGNRSGNNKRNKRGRFGRLLRL